jgi:hypothetical protein
VNVAAVAAVAAEHALLSNNPKPYRANECILKSSQCLLSENRERQIGNCASEALLWRLLTGGL